MRKETTNFIANILTEKLKEETRNYQSIYSAWVSDLIDSTKDFFEDNCFCMTELNKLIKDYEDTKEWIDSKANKEE